jgi:signal transduction histidine kinase
MNPEMSKEWHGHDENLSRMNHELRTPLNAVIGFSRVLERNKAGNQRPEDIELLARIRANGEQLLQVVEQLLAGAEKSARSPVVDK